MQIVINIPKEFEEQWKQDRFIDSLERMEYDLFDSGGRSLSGRYEHEVIKMIKEKMKTAIELSEKHGRLIDGDNLVQRFRKIFKENSKYMSDREKSCMAQMIEMANGEPTILESGGEIMISVYCNYGLYNEDNCRNLEEGDYVDEFSYMDGERKVTLQNAQIADIKKDYVTLETDDFKCDVFIDDIVGWE